MKVLPEDLRNRVVQINGMIDDDCANHSMALLLFFNQQDANSPVVVKINSLGGSVTAALAILDTMRFVDCAVFTECHEMAYGAAALLFAAGKGGHRMAGSDATFGFTRVGSAVMRDEDPALLVYMQNLTRQLVAELAETCRQDPMRIAQDMNAERRFTTAQAIEYGLVDWTIPSPS